MYEADFVNCVAFRATGDFIAKYFTKGQKIGIQGTIRTGSYTAQDGSKHFTTNVQVENAEFVGGNGGNGSNGQQYANAQTAQSAPGNSQQEYTHQTSMSEGFQEVDDEDLPF